MNVTYKSSTGPHHIISRRDISWFSEQYTQQQEIYTDKANEFTIAS